MLESGKGGSIAGMAYNPCGTDGGALVLNDEILKNIFDRGEHILGKAFFAAKCSVIAWYPTQDTMYGPAVLYTLFGDPALRIKVPQVTGIAWRESPAGGAHDAMCDIYPNPGNGDVRIDYMLRKPGLVVARLYDCAGDLVRTLFSGYRSSGRHTEAITRNSELASGIYLLQLNADGVKTTRKLVVR